MRLGGIRILNTVSKFSEQIFLGIEDISDPGRKSIGEFPLLKNIQIGSEFYKGGGIRFPAICKAVFPYNNAEAENIPLPADFQVEVDFFVETSRLVVYTWGKGHICLSGTQNPNRQENCSQQEFAHGIFTEK